MISVKNSISLLLLVFSILPSYAFAGGQESHGGGAQVCYTDALMTKIKSVELYDLYEGKTYYHFPEIQLKGRNVHQVLKQIDNRLLDQTWQRRFPQLLNHYVNFVRTHLQFKNEIETLHDAHLHGVEENCEYKQLAVWDDANNRILVKKIYFDQLIKNPIQETAFYVHEAIYFLYRDLLGAIDSDDTRKLNAEIFSAAKLDSSLLSLFDAEIVRHEKIGLFPDHSPKGSNRSANFRDDQPMGSAAITFTAVDGDVEMAWIAGKGFQTLKKGESIQIPLTLENLNFLAQGKSTVLNPRLWVFFKPNPLASIRVTHHLNSSHDFIKLSDCPERNTEYSIYLFKESPHSTQCESCVDPSKNRF